ncbi:MAG: hypothetical protein CVV44_23260 [Spirochaetae bacterium HGW-Spirochaetae-1]|jgi:hypothetical protein|nr:MAG: hypothetical protein CVV44_23260 [Spirochaetae bacterium HGW-Spirochaetae-1]
MNKDIKIMIELQRYWDNISLAKKEIERCSKNITYWENELAQKEKMLLKMSQDLKTGKADLREKELHLNELDDRIKKLESRRIQLKTEREMEALDNEMKKVKSDDEELEGHLLELMESLEIMENEILAEQTLLQEQKAETAKSVEKLNNDIQNYNSIVSSNKNSFDSLLPNLHASHQSRFTKLLQSKDGKAIGEVHGEICGTCNFQIPSQLAQDASSSVKTVSCTNCGRYIYKQ